MLNYSVAELRFFKLFLFHSILMTIEKRKRNMAGENKFKVFVILVL